MALLIAIVMILAGSIGAHFVNTSGGTVKVSRIAFDTDQGKLSGLLYLPKGASQSSPRPAVVLTHGYLNSAEMQDANAIELSRRGYVVLDIDMYDHGHSRINRDKYSGTDFFSLWSEFWTNSIYDAVQYIYEQPYVLKDADGNGIIGVTGHSMGGFSTTVALAKDEADYAVNGFRKISCGLSEGSDFSYSGIVGVTAEAADKAGGGRIMGKVAARYDEFFFNDPETTGGTVRRKDYVATPDAKTFLGQESPAADTWYNTSDGGKRIIYEPSQTHPWNHFSKTTTADAIDFYQTAFSGYTDGISNIPSSYQTWMWKEALECLALIGFVLLIVPLAGLVLKLPFFSKSVTGEPVPQRQEAGTGTKFAGFASLVFMILLPALFFTSLWDADHTETGMNILFFAGIIFCVSGIYAVISSRKETAYQKNFRTGGIFVAVSGALLSLVIRTPMYQDLTKWTAPAVNNIAYWTIACALISLLGMSVIYVSSKAKNGTGFDAYGITFRPAVIVSSFAAALLTVVVSYAVLFLVDKLLLTDFRIWTFAFKTFDANILRAVFRYWPTFFVYYLISGAAVFVNTNTEKLQGIKGYLLAIALNAGGIFLWLIRQYGTLFATGTAAHPGASLSGIVLIAMVPTLSIAACFSRALYKRTGNVWLPAFLNSMLMTLMTIANTTVYFR